MIQLNSAMSLIRLNINDLNVSIKRQSIRLDKKQDPTVSYLQEMHFKYTQKMLKMKGWLLKKIRLTAVKKKLELLH